MAKTIEDDRIENYRESFSQLSEMKARLSDALAESKEMESAPAPDPSIAGQFYKKRDELRAEILSLQPQIEALRERVRREKIAAWEGVVSVLQKEIPSNIREPIRRIVVALKQARPYASTRVLMDIILSDGDQEFSDQEIEAGPVLRELESRFGIKGYMSSDVVSRSKEI